MHCCHSQYWTKGRHRQKEQRLKINKHTNINVVTWWASNEIFDIEPFRAQYMYTVIVSLGRNTIFSPLKCPWNMHLYGIRSMFREVRKIRRSRATVRHSLTLNGMRGTVNAAAFIMGRKLCQVNLFEIKYMNMRVLSSLTSLFSIELPPHSLPRTW